jgi:hypothetical protein
LVCLAVLLALSACSEDKPDNRPSAKALGEGALQGGVMDDKKAATCVGNLIREAGLRQDTLVHIARGDLDGGDPDWVLGEGEIGLFEADVEWEMSEKCGVEPWPWSDPVPFEINAHCGVEFIEIDGETWRTKLRDDGHGNPPEGWPQIIDGELSIDGRGNTAIFTSDEIPEELVFRPAPRATWHCD